MERELKRDGSNAHWCDVCKTDLAATSCVDALEMKVKDGTEWVQMPPRYGCLKHPVSPTVTFADGKKITWADYLAAQA